MMEINDNIPEYDRIEWMLLTTLPIETNEHVREIINYF